MKKLKFLLFLLIASNIAMAQVGIGTTTPSSSAVLDLTSTTKGFLPPRLTTIERNAIVNPAEGSFIYNTTEKCMQWFGGQTWYSACSGVETWPPNYVHCNPSNPTVVVAVTNATTGKIWMDRNLGANRAATSSTDAQSYGSLFQWGRRADGHQCVNRYVGDGVTTSSNIGTTSSTDTPAHGDFITATDWRSPQNNNLWQGIAGINNPCPSGYRVPTETEFNAERLSWTSLNISGAHASVLKWSMPGFRETSGGVSNLNTLAYVLSSTISSSNIRRLSISLASSAVGNDPRGRGETVRCIKD